MNHNHIGIDIIEIDRIRHALGRWNRRFLTRVFTEAEVELYHDRPESLAARFAAKEAVIKAISPVDGWISWKEIEILSQSNGQPLVKLKGRTLELADKMGLDGFDISLSHSKEYAVAFVIGYKSR